MREYLAALLPAMYGEDVELRWEQLTACTWRTLDLTYRSTWLRRNPLCALHAAMRWNRPNEPWAAVQQEPEVSVALGTEYTLAAQFAMHSAVAAANLAFEIAGVS